MGACQTKDFEKSRAEEVQGSNLRHKIVQKNHLNAVTIDHETAADHYLRSFLSEVESVLRVQFAFRSDKERDAVSLSFMNSCAEIIRTKFRLKMETVMDIITRIAQTKKLRIILDTLPLVKECYVDAGFARLLNTWANGSNGGSQSPSNIGKSIDGRDCGNTNREVCNFASSLIDHLISATLFPTMDLFPSVAGNEDVMTVEQLGKFIRETQNNDVSDSQVTEKYRYRFGGVIHRYNFNTYLMGLMTNNAIDLSRTTSVWQDMTQPLTRYLVRTTRIESEDDLQRALADNSRAYVLRITKNSEGVLCSGSCRVTRILEGIKNSGFVTNPYPIILCLSPPNNISVRLKDELAEVLKNGLDTMLASGLMFEGAVISDPKFSPSAQRKKVLVLGYQSRLKPFVGSLMADMNRDGLGVRVTDVLPGTPAAKAGVSKDDWFTHINGEAIVNKKHLREHLDRLKLGEEFTLKKENLDELKIVVGGTVDQEDTSESSALSNLLFLKYTQESDNLKPWETRVLAAEALHPSDTRKSHLDDHFAFFSGEKSDSADYIGVATRMGVQLIDCGNSKEGALWAQGRFLDNGGSGYLIKCNTDGKAVMSVTVELLAGPQEIKALPFHSGTARIHGAGAVTVEGNKIVFEGCNETTVGLIDCAFGQDNSSFRFAAAFPPLLLRCGYRVLRLEQTGGPTITDDVTLGAFCLISWNKEA